MKIKASILIAIVLSLFFAAPSQAGRLGTKIEGTITSLDAATKHATLVTKDGKSVSFRWTETTKFVTATPLSKGAHVLVDYHAPTLGEAYVNSVDVRAPK